MGGSGVRTHFPFLEYVRVRSSLPAGKTPKPYRRTGNRVEPNKVSFSLSPSPIGFYFGDFSFCAFLQQRFQKKAWFRLLQVQDVCLFGWPCGGISCLEESTSTCFLCTKKIRRGLSGLHSCATHGGCSAWSPEVPRTGQLFRVEWAHIALQAPQSSWV